MQLLYITVCSYYEIVINCYSFKIFYTQSYNTICHAPLHASAVSIMLVRYPKLCNCIRYSIKNEKVVVLRNIKYELFI